MDKVYVQYQLNGKELKIFVTGGTGFIGSHFLHSAIADGHYVTALRCPGSAPRIKLEKDPDWVEGEMSGEYNRHLKGCDAFVHLAAVGVSPQKADWKVLFKVNVAESIQLMVQAADAGIRRFTVCGSCFEYGKSAERYEFIPPDAPLEPVNAYGASKAAASMAAHALAVERSLELVIVRPFNIYGEGQHESNFWPSLRRAAIGGEDFRMTSGRQIRDFMDVVDASRAILQECRRSDISSGLPIVRNLGSGTPVTLLEFAEACWSQWDAKGRILAGTLPERDGEIMRYVPSLASS